MAAWLVNTSAHASVEMCADPTMRVSVEMQAILQAAAMAAAQDRTAVSDLEPTPSVLLRAIDDTDGVADGVGGTLAAGEMGPTGGAPNAAPPHESGPGSSMLEDALSASPLSREGEGEGGGDVPWCVSPDDPRCSQRGGGAPGQRVEGRAPLYTVASVELDAPRPRDAHSFNPRPGLGPVAGVSSRVERPPRAARRPV